MGYNGAPTTGYISPEQRQKMLDMAQAIYGSPMTPGQSGNFQANSWWQVLGKMAQAAAAHRMMQNANQGYNQSMTGAQPGATGMTPPPTPAGPGAAAGSTPEWDPMSVFGMGASASGY